MNHHGLLINLIVFGGVGLWCVVAPYQVLRQFARVREESAGDSNIPRARSVRLWGIFALAFTLFVAAVALRFHRT